MRRLVPHLPFAALVTAYAIRFSVLSVAVHDGFGTPGFDLGIFDQGIWLLSRFHAPFVTVMGRNLFGDHTSFILVLLVPLYWVYPHVQAILVVQSCLLALGGVPVYLLARKRAGTVVATLLGGAYLLNPALQHGNLEQFHPECFLVVSIGFAIWAAVERHPRILAVAVAASLLVKEDTAFLVIPLGIWVLWRRNRRWGLAIVAVAVVYLVVAFKVVIHDLLGTSKFYAGRIPFGGVVGLVSTTFTHPGRLWAYLRADNRPWYVFQMLGSFGFVMLAAPELAAIGVLALGENVISNFGYMHRIEYHYSLSLVPVLALGTVWAVTRLRPRIRLAAASTVAASALVAGTVWGLAPWSVQTYPHWSPSSPQARALDYVIAGLPPRAVVSAWYPVIAHVDHRVGAYQWPTPFSAHYWGLYTQEGLRLPQASTVDWLVLPESMSPTDQAVFATIRSHFAVARQRDGYALYHRIAP